MLPFSRLKLAFLGCGQMAQSLIQGYLAHSEILPENVYISGRKWPKTTRIASKFKVQACSDNEELLCQASVIFLCVKPRDAKDVIQDLRNSFESHHTFISVQAGVTMDQMQKWGLASQRVIRIMPNLACRLAEGFIPFCVYKNKPSLQAFAEEILNPLGMVMLLEKEELLKVLTVGSASGLGFFLEILEYWVEWLQEQGFPYEKARQISTQTLIGSGILAKQNPQKKLMDLQKEVVSPQGVTAAGLTAMRELELERILRLSFEKACLKEQELSRGDS